ncbi:MAG: ribonuclease H family protein [Paludibacteraceae bacterium]|nr:ribonuclease H family protein [Paludibacteraceae bacterium]
MAEKKAPKFYVVWVGKQPGIFNTWAECKAQVENFTGARYKSYPTLAEAQKAYADGWQAHVHPSTRTLKQEENRIQAEKQGHETLAIAVDAACSGNPGKMEYRGVDLTHNREIFHAGPFPCGTNNIGEFLAIVHGLSLLKQRNCPYILYSDSVNAISWVKQKQCKTKLPRNEKTAALLDIVARAENWLRNNTYTTEIRKWETKIWGEIPADFGRK